jgi:hypothetical protein
MGYTLAYANRMSMATLTPRSDLASSKYCLANPGTEYVVYQPRAGEAFSVELKAGTYRYQWFNPANGTPAGPSPRRSGSTTRSEQPTASGTDTTARTALAAQAGEGRIEALGGGQQFQAPFESPSVLHLWKGASP